MKRLAVLTVILLMPKLLSGQSEEKKAEIRANINWMYGSTEAPAKASAYLFAVPVGAGLTSIRGNVSAQTCLYWATIFALDGDNSKANHWLQAGQCHNGNVMQLFADYPSYCAKYIIDTYAEQAIKSFGLAYVTHGTIQYIKPALKTIEGHNPDRGAAPKEEGKDDDDGTFNDRIDGGDRKKN